MRRVLSRLTVAVLAIVLLTACSGGMPFTGADSDSGSAPAMDAPADSDASGEAAADDQPDERQVITTAEATVMVDSPRAAVSDVLARTEGVDGYVEHRSEHMDDDGVPSSAWLRLRVPADSLPGLLDELDDVGEVADRSQSSQDVTDAVRDLDARIRALEVSVERLLDIMEVAETSADLLEAESTLSERQAQLEALVAERDALGDQVEMSTLEIELVAADRAHVQADGFLGGLQSGWNAFVTFINGLLVALGAVLPWLVILGVPAFLLAFLLRRRRARRRKQALSGSAGLDQRERDGFADPTAGQRHE